MALSLPRNAQRIIEMRRQGAVLNGVVVSYVGKTSLLAPHVHCDSGERYSWGFLQGLQAYLVVRPGINCLDAVAGLFKAANLKAGLPLLIDIDRSIATHVVGPRELGMQWKEGSPQWRQIFPVRVLDQLQDKRGAA